MKQTSIPFSDFRIAQRQERRRWTIGAIVSATGAGAGSLFLFGPVTTGSVVAGTLAGVAIGIGLVCVSQIFRIRIAQIMLDEQDQQRQGRP